MCLFLHEEIQDREGGEEINIVTERTTLKKHKKPHRLILPLWKRQRLRQDIKQHQSIAFSHENKWSQIKSTYAANFPTSLPLACSTRKTVNRLASTVRVCMETEERMSYWRHPRGKWKRGRAPRGPKTRWRWRNIVSLLHVKHFMSSSFRDGRRRV